MSLKNLIEQAIKDQRDNVEIELDRLYERRLDEYESLEYAEKLDNIILIIKAKQNIAMINLQIDKLKKML